MFAKALLLLLLYSFCFLLYLLPLLLLLLCCCFYCLLYTPSLLTLLYVFSLLFFAYFTYFLAKCIGHNKASWIRCEWRWRWRRRWKRLQSRRSTGSLCAAQIGFIRGGCAVAAAATEQQRGSICSSALPNCTLALQIEVGWVRALPTCGKCCILFLIFWFHFFDT